MDERCKMSSQNLFENPYIICNFCGTKFDRTGINHSEFLPCPFCDSIARERVAFYYILNKISRVTSCTNLFLKNNKNLKTKRILEFSPRYNNNKRMIYKETFHEYLSADKDWPAHKGDI